MCNLHNSVSAYRIVLSIRIIVIQYEHVEIYISLAAGVRFLDCAAATARKFSCVATGFLSIICENGQFDITVGHIMTGTSFFGNVWYHFGAAFCMRHCILCSSIFIIFSCLECWHFLTC